MPGSKRAKTARAAIRESLSFRAWLQPTLGFVRHYAVVAKNRRTDLEKSLCKQGIGNGSTIITVGGGGGS